MNQMNQVMQLLEIEDALYAFGLEKDTTEERAGLHVARHVTTEDYIQMVGVRGTGYHGM